MDEEVKRKPMGEVIRIDEARIRDHLGEMVRGTLEEALNAMLDAEADRLCGVGKYERTEGAKDIVHQPACVSEQSCDPAVAVPTILARQLDHVGHQTLFISTPNW